jgi:hypothetical protein
MTATIIGQLVAKTVGAAIGALIGALFIQLGTKWIAKFKPSYGTAYLAAFLGYLASFVVGVVIGLFVGMSGHSFGGSPVVLSMVIGFSVAAAIYGLLIKHPETGPIGFGKACLVALVQLLLSGVILAIIVLVVIAMK